MSSTIKNPLVSVIVPVYNAAEYLRTTLNCICNQTIREIEIIIVDDGSTDDTPDILQEYAAKDSRIILLQQQHEFAGAARNKGMAIARGKYYSFLDSDDIFAAEMLEKMVQQAEKETADIVVCHSEIFDSQGNTRPLSWGVQERYLSTINREHFSLKKDYAEATFQMFVGWAWDKLFRVDFVKKHGFQFGPTRHGNDGPFVFPALAAADCISILSDTLIQYRQSETQISNSGNISKHPTAGCTSVEHIATNLHKLEIPHETWHSFAMWVANYICWNMKKLHPIAQEQLRHHIRNEFDHKFNIQHTLNQCRNIPACANVYAALERDIKQYGHIISPEISVVLPIYNAELYLREALDSLLKQSFEQFEAICVNDGSTDNSLSILHEYAAKDSRIRILDGPNGGYGKAMNRGLQAVQGKYFAILEPDDYLPQDAYKTLHNLAETHQLELVRGKFTRICTGKDGKRVFTEEKDFEHVGKVIKPRDYHVYFYNMSLATWTGLYRVDFLKEQDISYHESPGASYQDTGFFMQTFGYAERAMLTNEVVYMYRIDNAASSTNTKSGKPHAMQNEFAFIKDKYLSRPERWQNLQELYLLRRMAAHRWMYNSIPESVVADYLISFRKELLGLQGIDRKRFVPVDKNHYEQLIISPIHFLNNAGKFPGGENVILQLFNPFEGATFTNKQGLEISETPAVSVIVPIYSGLEKFALMLALLRAQTLRNIELIFIHDQGKDGTFALAEQAAQDDPRIKLIYNEKNLGPGASRNKGIAAATGEYIAFVDADDIIPVDYYEKLYTTACNTGAKVVKCSRVNMFSNGLMQASTKNASIRSKLAEGEHILNAFAWEHTTAIYNREHVIRNGARNSDAKQDEDTTFIMMTLHNLENKDLVVIDNPVYYYRMHEQSVTQIKDINYLSEGIKSLDDKLAFILSQPSTPPMEKYAASQIENRLHWRYQQVIESDLISNDQRKAYVEKIYQIILTYIGQRPQHSLFGYSERLATGKLTVEGYIAHLQKQRHKTPTTTPDLVTPTKELQAYLCDYPRYKAKYLRHRILYWLSVGKSHKKHKEKMRQLKPIIRNWRNVIKQCMNNKKK